MSSTLRQAAQQALEAWDGGDTEWFKRAYTVMENLRAALAEPVQEPVAWLTHGNDLRPLFHKTKAGALAWGSEPQPLYTSPPQRKPLTEGEAAALIALDHRMLKEFGTAPSGAAMELIRRTERAHGMPYVSAFGKD